MTSILYGEELGTGFAITEVPLAGSLIQRAQALKGYSSTACFWTAAAGGEAPSDASESVSDRAYHRRSPANELAIVAGVELCAELHHAMRLIQ